MHPNEDLIRKFYQSFKDKNVQSMIECYHDEIEFTDPAFDTLKGMSAKAMWMMLIERSTDLLIEYKNIKADDQFGSADWIATYSFSKTNRTVVNKIHARFEFKDGKILKHRDRFSLWKWAGMALGISGYLLGFTPAIQNKIKEDAQNGLKIYMKRKRLS